jgi:hypothetical protein
VNTVDEKYSQLMGMNDRIGAIDPEAKWKDVHLIALLLGSIPPEYETVVDLISDRAQPDLADVVNLLRKKEEQLIEKPEGHALTVKTSSNVICNHCGKRGHMWRKCRIYLATEEGKKFLEANPQWTPGSSAYGTSRKPWGPQQKRIGRGNIAVEAEDSDEDAFGYANVIVANAAIAADSYSWIVDSGASRHICRRKRSFLSLKPISGVILTANGTTLKVHSEGRIELTIIVSGRQQKLILERVLYVPECSFNLLSVYELTRDGMAVQAEHDSLRICQGTYTIAEAISQNGTYLIQTPGVALATQMLATKQLWHRRLGHLGENASQQIEALVNGLASQRIIGHCYEACRECKATRQVSRVPMRLTDKKLARIHIDIWGPSPVESLRGKRYMLILVDDYTRMR